MLKRYSFSFYEVMSRIEYLRHGAEMYCRSSSSYAASKVPDYALANLNEALTKMRVECEKLDLIPTAELISHIESEVRLKGQQYSYTDLSNHLNTLSFSFTSGLGRNSCFRIASEKDKYFEKENIFGPEVGKAFGSCTDEIRNAGNCYALEQNEASAFHSMKILERGLGVLAGKFGVDFNHTNWQNVIDQIEKQIKGMNSNSGANWKEQKKFYSQAAIHFRFLKDAWRNHIMHVGDAYDEGKALSVFDHVRQFMQALAEGGLKE